MRIARSFTEWHSSVAIGTLQYSTRPLSLQDWLSGASFARLFLFAL